jgi:methyl-accepting chemotaxis protein
MLSVKGGNDMRERVIEISEELQRDMNATVAMVAQNAENARIAMQIAQDIARQCDDLQKLITEISAANDEQAAGVKFIMNQIEKSADRN